jgi:hypothetical protein
MSRVDEIEYMLASREINAAAHQIELDALKAKLELSMQAVQFYASQTSYSSSWVISDRTPIHAMEDKGRVAKNALAAIEKLEGKGDE